MGILSNKLSLLLNTILFTVIIYIHFLGCPQFPLHASSDDGVDNPILILQYHVEYQQYIWNCCQQNSTSWDITIVTIQTIDQLMSPLSIYLMHFLCLVVKSGVVFFNYKVIIMQSESCTSSNYYYSIASGTKLQAMATNSPLGC